jgi:hypothetical protein
MNRLVFFFILAITAFPVLAEDIFHISYRQQNLSSDGLNQSGILLVTIVNVSGEDVKDMMASVPGPNNVTYDNRAILIGDLGEGAQNEILDEFQVPQELNTGAVDDRITWEVEYTDSTGQRLNAEVTGERVPE